METPTGEDASKDHYLWGNVPAIDVLKLKENEGEDFEKEMNLLFAGESVWETSSPPDG